RDLELPVARGAVPDLDEPDVVAQCDLYLALAAEPDESGLERGVADLLAVLVDDPGAGEVVEERTPVVGEDQLLAELEAVDRRVVAVPVAAPGAEHPRQRRA